MSDPNLPREPRITAAEVVGVLVLAAAVVGFLHMVFSA